MSDARPSLADQALAVWALQDCAPRLLKPEEIGNHDPWRLSCALAEAKVTLNLIAATPELREMVEAALEAYRRERRL